MDSQRAARVIPLASASRSRATPPTSSANSCSASADAKNNTGCVELGRFPDEVVQLLRSSVLCYLSTLADGAPPAPDELYCPADEKIIMSTPRHNRARLLKNKRVAVLIHDFPAEERQRAAAASARAAGHGGDCARAFSVAARRRPGRDGRRGQRPRDAFGTERRGPAAV